MYRIILTAYLSLSAAFGPTLCCCSLEHLSGMGGSDNCCVSHKAQAPREHHHRHDGHDHDGHSHTHHHHGSAPDQTAVQPAASPTGERQICDGRSCECGRDKNQLSILPKQGELKAQLTDLWALPQSWDISVLVLRTRQADFCEQTPPPLFGRGILRAYQILVI